jgi:hypothetical protein
MAAGDTLSTTAGYALREQEAQRPETRWGVLVKLEHAGR